MQKNEKKKKKLELKNLPKTILAPMAGLTDCVFREIVRKNSPETLFTTEMISSEALQHNPEGIISNIENDYGLISAQLVGHKVDLMAKCAKILEKKDASAIDINMGCPVKKIVVSGDGSALMKTPHLAFDIVQAVKESVKIAVSVKMRLGYSQDLENFVDFAQKMQLAGADFITIHARYRSQLYSGSANWEKIAELVKNVDIPVFANGDITSVESAKKCLEITNAHGVAIGRAALSDPVLICNIEKMLQGKTDFLNISFEEKIEILKKFLESECKLRTEKVAVKFMRKFYPYFIASVRNACTLREQIMRETEMKKVLEILDNCKKLCLT